MSCVCVVVDTVDEGGLARWSVSPQLRVVTAIKNPAKLKESLPGAHALLVRSETKVTAEMMAQAPQLKVIGRAGIGVDNINAEEAPRRGVTPAVPRPGQTINATTTPDTTPWWRPIV